jgi:hypothetical protein
MNSNHIPALSVASMLSQGPGERTVTARRHVDGVEEERSPGNEMRNDLNDVSSFSLMPAP